MSKEERMASPNSALPNGNALEGPSKLNRAIPWVLSLFALLGILPLFYYPDPTFYHWINGGLVKSLYGIVVALLFVGFALVVWKKNKVDPPLRYELMFLWVLLYSVLLAFVHERSASIGNGQVYTLPWTSLLLYEAESFYDLFFAFAFLFLWPYMKKEPKYKNVLPYLVVLLGVISVIYGLIKGPESTDPYKVYTSFFSTSENLGKVLFASAFCASVLAIEKKGVLRIIFLLLGFGLTLSAAFLGLSITFWALIGATGVIAFVVLNSPRSALSNKTYRWVALTYLFLAGALLGVLLIPSSASSYLKAYFGNEFTSVFSARSKTWSAFLDSLSSWRLFIGDGAMGYCRASLLGGNVSPSTPYEEVFTPLSSGVMETYDAGGIVYLMFYVLIIVVGLSRFKKAESHHSTFYAVVLSFTGAFFLYTVISSERLLFSSSFLSFVVAYLFTGYPRYKDPGEESL